MGKFCYRPQRSCGQGYVFTRVCDSVHGVCLSTCCRPPGADTPPWEQTPPPPAYCQWTAGTHPTRMHSCIAEINFHCSKNVRCESRLSAEVGFSVFCQNFPMKFQFMKLKITLSEFFYVRPFCAVNLLSHWFHWKGLSPHWAQLRSV